MKVSFICLSVCLSICTLYLRVYCSILWIEFLPCTKKNNITPMTNNIWNFFLRLLYSSQGHPLFNALCVVVSKLEYKKLITLCDLRLQIAALIDLQPFIISRWKIFSHFSFDRANCWKGRYSVCSTYENLRSFSRHYSMSSSMFWRGDQMKALVFLSIALAVAMLLPRL